MASNFTPSTATAITSLPFTEDTDPVDSVTPSVLVPTCGSEFFPLWWSITPDPDTTALGIAIASSADPTEYQPAVSVWTGTLPVTLTQLDNCCYTFNDPTWAQIGVTPGTTYYILVALGGGSGVFASAPITVSVSTLSDATPGGSLLITSDIGNQAAVVINDTDGTSLRGLGMAASEMGDFLDTGELAIMAEDPADANTAVGIQIWDRDLVTLTTTVTSIIRANQLSLSPIRSDRNGTWYVSSVLSAAAAVINTVTAAGAVGGTSWTLPANSAAMTCMGVTQDGATLYYGNDTNNQPLYAYNLNTSSALPNFLAAPGANLRWQRDIWVLANGDVLLVQINASTNAQNVLHYNSSAVLQYTYPISTGLQDNVNPRVALSMDETYFCVMSFPSNGVSRFQFFDLGTITPTLTFDIDQNDNAGEGPAWGPSQSCPLLMLPLSVTPPPGEGTTRAIRRVRRALLPASPSNNRMKIPELQVLLQPGIGDGDPDSQGYDPQVMLRISKDGGKTYLPEQWESAGKQGEYTKRVAFHRTPNTYRNGVVEVVVTDPNDWTLVDLVAPSIEEGTS